MAAIGRFDSQRESEAWVLNPDRALIPFSGDCGWNVHGFTVAVPHCTTVQASEYEYRYCHVPGFDTRELSRRQIKPENGQHLMSSKQ
jgi:hypothetical protein